MPCCMCEKYEWDDPQDVVYTAPEDGKEYCLFHAPAEHKGMSVDDFNAQVSERIQAIVDLEDANARCSFNGTIFPGKICIDKECELPNISFIFCVFVEHASFVSAEFGSYASFVSAEFRRGADFQKAKFVAIASFASAEFVGEVSFASAEFVENVSFLLAKFVGKVSFASAKFVVDADFHSAEFVREVSFDSAEFVGEVSFAAAKFVGNVFFASAKFVAIASFASAKFVKHASFSSAEFGERGDFEKAEFVGYVDFHSAEFVGEVSFDSAKFVGGVSFAKVEFVRYVLFCSAKFGEMADFSSVKFGGYVGFNSAKFVGNVNFSEASIGGDANFSEASIGGDANFSEASIAGDANFSEASIGGDADFTSAKFERGASFREARFGGGADFVSASFGGATLFQAIKFKDYPSQSAEDSPTKTLCFANCAIPTQMLTFQKCDDLSYLDLTDQPDLTNIRFHECAWGDNGRIRLRIEDKKLQPTRDFYQRMKAKYKDENNEYEASKWHVAEKEAQLKVLAGRKGEGFNWLMLWLYKLVSEFGENSGRAFGVLMGILVLPLLFSSMDISVNFLSWTFHSEMVADPIGHWLKFIPLTRAAHLEPSSGWRAGMFFWQLLITLQAALFAFALRNNFRR